jgi:hypothetical protein
VPSCDAELVAFRVEQHDVAKVLAVGFLALGCCPGGNQLGHSRANELRSLGHVPWRLSGYPDIDVHPVLGRLRLWHPEEADGRAATFGIDDRSAVGVVITGLIDIPQREGPEGGQPVRVCRVAAKRPVRCHRLLLGQGRGLR